MGDRILGEQVQRIKQILEQSKIGLTGRGRDISRVNVGGEEEKHSAQVLLKTHHRVQGPKERRPRTHNKRFVAPTRSSVDPHVTEHVSRKLESGPRDLVVSVLAQTQVVSPLRAVSLNMVSRSSTISSSGTSNYVDFAIKIATLMKKNTLQTVDAKQSKEEIPSVINFGPPPLIFTPPTRMPSKPYRRSKQQALHKPHKSGENAATASASLLTGVEYVRFAVAITHRLKCGF